MTDRGQQCGRVGPGRDAACRRRKLLRAGWLDHNDGIGGADEPAVHLAAHLLGDHMRIDGIADHGRADEQDQLGAGARHVLVRERVAHAGDLVQDRNALALLVLALADQAREQYGLKENDACRPDRGRSPKTRQQQFV